MKNALVVERSKRCPPRNFSRGRDRVARFKPASLDELRELADEAEQRGEADRAVDFFKRLADIATSKDDKAQMILRQARLLVDPLGELEGAVDCYRAILEQIDPNNRDALSKIAELELQRGEFASAASALESLLKLTEAREERPEGTPLH